MDYGKKIDAETWDFIHKAGEYYPPETATYTVAQQRKIYDKMCGAFFRGYPEGVTASDQLIGTIPTRHYTSNDAPATVMYFHGGGFVVGGLESHDDVCAEICNCTGLDVVSVDYRLAPEHLHPAMHDDCLAATRHILTTTNTPILLAGDSAGGNLSAVVTLLAREQGAPKLACQLLIYPATDMLMRFPSHAICGDGYRLTRTSIAWFISGYLRDGEDMYDMRASPLMAESHTDLPPAFVMTAAFDPLKDEGEAYAEKLQESGVKVKYSCYQGMVHGFIAMPGAVDMAKTALLDAASYIKQQLSG